MSLFAQGIIRIVSQPEIIKVGDTSVAKFYGGINEGKDKNGNWVNNAIDVEIWGKQAEVLSTRLSKSDSFFAHGQIFRQEWEGKDGKRSKHVFRVNRFEFLPRPVDVTPTEAETMASAGMPF